MVLDGLQDGGRLRPGDGERPLLDLPPGPRTTQGLTFAAPDLLDDGLGGGALEDGRGDGAVLGAGGAAAAGADRSGLATGTAPRERRAALLARRTAENKRIVLKLKRWVLVVFCTTVLPPQ